MAKGFGAPKAAPKFRSRFKTGFASKFGQVPKVPGPPKPKTIGKVSKPKFIKIGKI